MNKSLLPIAVSACVLGLSAGVQAERYAELFASEQEYQNSDPLYFMQWHLDNTGQRAAAKNPGDAGNDINTTAAHVDYRVLGESVKVAVVDSGMAIAHEDLAANVLPGRSRNYVAGAADPTDPTPPRSETGGDHGTSVAGLIAARGFNGLGGRGVAPLAKLMGFNWLESQSYESWVETHGGAGVTDDARVINQSYGFSPIWPVSFDSVDNAQEESHLASVNRRVNQGKGIAFVKSAGNSFSYLSNVASVFKYKTGDGASGPLPWWCSFYPSSPQCQSSGSTYTPDFIFSADARDTSKSQAQSLPAQVAASEPSNASFYHTTISALSAGENRVSGRGDGDVLSSYSTVGASVWVSAHGGEYGDDNPAMVTVDIEGCNAGYASSGASTAFNNGSDRLNDECNYTSTFNGTSSAAPVTSGAFALIFDANPDLSWRDAKDILAKTASKIGSNFRPIVVDTGLGDFVAEPGWFTNAAGYHFHNWYGFGRVDASAAVELALSPSYEPLPPLQVTSFIRAQSGSASQIPEGPRGVEQAIYVNDVLTVEAVQVKLSIQHGRDADLAVELISPAGTSSMVLTPRSMFVLDQGEPVASDLKQALNTQTDFNNTVFLSNAFYGEDAQGEWTVRVTDTNSGEFSFFGYKRDTREFKEITTENNSQLGRITAASLRIYGH
ncbi:S8 family serine peptidase [Agaribacterium haliotis]|uniref:S8 family serine peptidase n=1 Tax=Agaribacterium haliotis TaxID=2013869 RepID=UPI0013045BD7|nr:S8 family serine peptidase [Agaribacterium haliotis]